MTYILTKHSSKDFDFDKSKKYNQDAASKPKGFWFSNDTCEYNWEHFCRSQHFWLEALEFKKFFKFTESANILIIKNLQEFDDFCDTYIIKNDNAYGYFSSNTVDWVAVSEKYDGIYIPDYYWERRNSDSSCWYYGWDCASGCVWNLSALEEITQNNEG